MNKVDHRSLAAHGYRWVYDEAGAHFYSKHTATGWRLMRLLPHDLDAEKFEYMAMHDLTNTTKAEL